MCAWCFLMRYGVKMYNYLTLFLQLQCIFKSIPVRTPTENLICLVCEGQIPLMVDGFKIKAELESYNKRKQ